MVSDFDVENIEKIFDEKKTYELRLGGRNLNVIAAALDLPIIPSIEFMHMAEEVHDKILLLEKK